MSLLQAEYLNEIRISSVTIIFHERNIKVPNFLITSVQLAFPSNIPAHVWLILNKVSTYFSVGHYKRTVTFLSKGILNFQQMTLPGSTGLSFNDYSSFSGNPFLSYRFINRITRCDV